MKKQNILNAELIRQIARIGHTQSLVICDAGLPIPSGVDCIDLAVSRGLPGFTELLQAVLSELVVESYTYAQEMEQCSPKLMEQIHVLLPDIRRESVPHTEFKQRCTQANVIVRTGECSPYANIILTAGVNF